MRELPFVTVIMPIRNEARGIADTLGRVLAQDYPADCMEILVVDGISNDGTRQIIWDLQRQHSNLYLLDNPAKIVPTALNIALRQARGDVIIRVDGHTEIAPDYVRQCVETLQRTGADNVGGRMNAVGRNSFGNAVALATSTPFGIGGGRFHYSDEEEWVDTVYMGAWPRDVFEKIGMFDEELVRDQDDEFNYRLRARGGKVLLSPGIKSVYFVRSNLRALWRQYYQYGYWKVRVLQKHPLQMSPRQFAPPAFVAAVMVSVLMALLSLSPAPQLAASRASLHASFFPIFIRGLGSHVLLLPLVLILGMYVGANLAASIYTSYRKSAWAHFPLLVITFAALHFGYGLGFLVGLGRFSSRWNDRVGKVPAFDQAQDETESDRIIPKLVLQTQAGNSARPGWHANSIKRLVDILGALLGLVMLSPFFLVISILIKRESPGPVFYRGPRTGKNGKTFAILKFRTMYERSESHAGPRITAHDDGRVTPLGRWLRATKLNELPQLWNVLKGEMSLVGPRPEDLEIARTWPVSMRAEILSVRPGITSPASIVYRDEEKMLKSASVMDDYLSSILPDKLRLDLLYVRNHSLLSDLDVILMTLIVLLPRLRKNSISTETLYNGFLYRFARRYFSWFVIDNVTAFGAVSLAVLLKRMNGPLNLGIEWDVAIAALLALIFSLVNMILGLGRVWWRYARPAYAFDLAFSSGFSTIIVTTADWFWPRGRFFPPGTIIVAGVFAFLGFFAIRYRDRLLTGLATRWLWKRIASGASSGMGERVLIVGAGECGLLAAWLLHRSRLSSAFSIIGMVDDDPTKEGLMVDGHRVFGFTRRIPELVQQKDIGVILFAIEKIQPEEQARILDLCRQTKARIVLIPNLLSMFREQLTQPAS